MSGYLGRLLQAAARSEQRLYPFAGSIYGERTAETEQSFGPGLGVPHWAAFDRSESEQALPLPIAKTEEPELMMPFEQRATPQPRLDPSAFGSAGLNSPSALHPPAARPPDSIRTMRDRDEADPGASRIDAHLHLQRPRSETFAARAGDVTARRSAAVAIDQDHAPASDARLVRQAAPRATAALDIQQPMRGQNFASRLRAEEPEVQVHIGRIEVLAVQPPAPAAPAPRRETATRLADYLAARNGSSR